MIIAWIIGLVLSLLDIWILKNSREDGEPTLKMLHALLLGGSALIPWWNLVIGLATLMFIGITYYSFELEWKETKSSKFITFLNRKIS